MSSVLFLASTFIVLLIILGLLIYVIARLIALPATPDTGPVENPDQVACSPDEVLQVWLMDYPNPTQCPPWTNNYVIGTDYKMYEKNFQVTTTPSCCFYSNDDDARVYFPNPWICIGNKAGTFTVDQLNEKPYSYDGTAITYIVPPCQNNGNCIGLIRYGLDGNGNGLYKVFQYFGQGTINYTGNAPPPPDISTQVAQTMVVTVSTDCVQLEAITVSGQLVVQRNSQGQLISYDTNPQDRPQIVTDVINLFNSGQFYPIAGANPDLSNALASSS